MNTNNFKVKPGSKVNLSKFSTTSRMKKVDIPTNKNLLKKDIDTISK